MALNEPVLKSHGKSKSTPTVNECSPSTGPMSSDTEIFNRLIGEPSNPSMSCAEDSHVRTLASLEKVLDSPVNAADCGSSTLKRSKPSRRVTSSSKMSPPFALADWIKYSGRSLRSGMMRNGIVYPQAPLVPLTGGIGSGLWPTPTAQTYKQDVNDSGEYARRRLDAGQQINIALAVKLWPTPQAGAQNPAAHNAMSEDFKTKLCAAWGIPTTGQLNPQWVEWLMGYPVGWTDLGDSATPSFRKSRK